MATDAPSLASTPHRGDRAGRPGPRGWYLGAAGLAAIILAVVLVLVIGSGGSSAAAGPGLRAASHYGQDRSWIKIPEPTAPTAQLATPARPVLDAMEGYPVTARLAGGGAQVFMQGPTVPVWAQSQGSAGQLKSGEPVPATYSVRFGDVSGTVPLSAADFSIITYQGQLLHPRVTLASGAPLPAHLPAHTTTTLKLTTSLTEGDGEIRWAPEGTKILVAYFWTLEFD